MMKYAFYPGCSMDSTAKSYKLATEFVTDRIGMTLLEIKDWNCCGATAAHVKNDVLGIALPARSLALSERQYPNLDIVTGCAACYGRLKTAAHRVKNDNSMKYMVEKTIKAPYEAKREVLNFFDIFTTDEAMEAVRENITRPLTGLKAACYYGCLNARPAEITGVHDTENPVTMDDILGLAGIESVSWSFKTECCGAAHQNDAQSVAYPLPERIIGNAVANGADCIAVACPMCHMNLEMRQKTSLRKKGIDKLIPVFAFTELLAVAMGAHADEIALESHYVPAAKVLAETIRKNAKGGVRK